MNHVRTWAGLCAGAALLGGLGLAQPAVAQNAHPLGWGRNADSQASPVPTNVLNGVSSISAGYLHSMAVKNGRAYAWGNNNHGQTNVPAIALSGVTNVAAGGTFSLALKTDGSVQAWGTAVVATNVPAAAAAGVSKIAGGEWHALALKNGGVLAWGSNGYGQCTVPSTLTNGVTNVAAGACYSMALKNGGVQVFGIDASHDLAYGIRTVPSAATSGVTAVAAGLWHALALKNGGVIAWGAPFFDATDVPAAATSGVAAIAAGDQISIALKSNGTVVVWGAVGGAEEGGYGLVPIPNFASTGITQVAAGAGHCLVVGSRMPPRFLGARLLDANVGRPYTNGFIYATGTPAVVYYKQGTWPSWMTLDANSGAIGGTPTNEATISFNVVVSNVLGKATNEVPFVLSVVDVPEGPPVFVTTSPLPGGVVGAPYSLQFVVSNRPFFSWIDEGSGFPPGLTLTTNGLLSGTPTGLYESFFTVRASNMLGVSNRIYNLTIGNPTTQPVFVTTSPLPGGVVGQPYSATIVASNNPSFSLVSGGGHLPVGLTLNAGGAITGTPTQIENPTFTVRATNVVGGSNRLFSIEIFGPPVFTTASPLPLGVMGAPYSQQIGALGDPVFSVVAGGLPGGLGLTSAGWVTGMPTTVGTFGFTVHATNDYGWSNRVYQLEVAQIPVFFTTSPLPNGKIGVVYSNRIEASGNPTFSRIRGLMPTGLGLTGEGWVTGTPRVAVSTSITVRATNDYGWSNRIFDLTIDNYDPPYFTLVRRTNGNVRMEWDNPNVGGTIRVYRTTNLAAPTVVWSNFGVRTSPWTNVAPPEPSYYQLRISW